MAGERRRWRARLRRRRRQGREVVPERASSRPSARESGRRSEGREGQWPAPDKGRVTMNGFPMQAMPEGMRMM